MSALTPNASFRRFFQARFQPSASVSGPCSYSEGWFKYQEVDPYLRPQQLEDYKKNRS